MTKAGKLEREFYAFKKEVEARLAALETVKAPSRPTPTKVTKPSPVEEKTSDIVIEAKNDDIVAKDAE